MADIQFIKRNLQGLAFCGFWDYYEFKGWKKVFFEIYAYGMYLTFLVFNVQQIIEIYFVKDDVAVLMENFGVTLLVLVFMLKTGTILFRKMRIERLLTVMRNEETRVFIRSSEEIQIYRKNIDQNWFVTKFFWAVCEVTLFFFYILRPIEYLIQGPQEKHGYKIPFLFSAYYPCKRFTIKNYSIVYIHQILIGWFGAAYIAAGDNFIIACMIFAIGQYRLVQWSIRNIHLLNKEEMEMLLEDDILDIYPKIVDTVKHHCRIIDFLEDLDDLINPIIFVNFLVCSLMICAVGFEAIVSGPSVRLVQAVQYLVALLIQLFLLYWHANEVTLESENVGTAVADSQWYRFSYRVKQALLIILARAQKPSVLSVGGFYPMSLATFLMILRATYSYLALFRNMYSEEDD